MGLLALYVGAAPGQTPNLSFHCLQELFLSDHRNLHQVEARFVEFGIAIQPLQDLLCLLVLMRMALFQPATRCPQLSSHLYRLEEGGGPKTRAVTIESHRFLSIPDGFEAFDQRETR